MGLLRLDRILVLIAGCSTEFAPQPCSVDADCGSGLVCEKVNAEPVCVHAEDAPLVIGHHSALSGSSTDLGTNMKLGIDLAFAEQNEKGGVRGRLLKLDFRDDVYDPTQAETAARVLLDVQATNDTPHCPSTMNPPVGTAFSTTALVRGPKAVLAMLGNVGTPTMVRAAPLAVETGTVFFGAFTGAATILRDNKCGECAKYIFNVRASYAQEARATVEFFRRKLVGGGSGDGRMFISFDQQDSFGDAGYAGLQQAYRDVYGADPPLPITRFQYQRATLETSTPSAAVATEAYLVNLLNSTTGSISVGIMMTDTYGAAELYIKHLRDWQNANDAEQTTTQKGTRLKLYFSNVSFVGANSLASRLAASSYVMFGSGGLTTTYADGVVVSQVVPNYQSDNSDVVAAYNKLIAGSGKTPSFTSLEGYIATRVFIAGLLEHEGPFTPDSLVKDFESLGDVQLGIGAAAGFSSTNHQYSQSVWGTVLNKDGTFRNLYFWAQGIPIQFFE